jgi:macrolide transport system ATP-binding/permease protein
VSPHLIELHNVCRHFETGSETVTVLRDISFSICAGEMVAIVGASGSGKSTLMNIIGCLDKPSEGEVRLEGTITSPLSMDALAQLRSHYIGFIFQHYHLLSYLSAQENVEIPAQYTDMPAHERQLRSQHLLSQLGLEQRMHHRPAQLSGGQQQRVSICRALMNGAPIILADEPTGALDSGSGQALMAILHSLNQAGHTIILVTHDRQIAHQARRIIEIHDGQLIADTPNPHPEEPGALASAEKQTDIGRSPLLQSSADALRMAIRALQGHRARAFLSMLGIIIGIASVVSSMAVGEGARQSITTEIGKLGNSTLNIFPGMEYGVSDPTTENALSKDDLALLKTQPWVKNVSPMLYHSAQAVYHSRDITLAINGIGSDFFRIQGLVATRGDLFTLRDETRREPVVVIDEPTRRSLFTPTQDPIGQIILIAGAPWKIVAVAKRAGPEIIGGLDNVWMPWTSLRERLIKNKPINAISVQVNEGVELPQAKTFADTLLLQLHGKQDFYTRSDDLLARTMQKASNSLSLLITSIAGISLLVGGIGVMNIMLVSVTERTREIGIRLAVGARPREIMLQFLMESMVICLIGGLLGIFFAWVTGQIFLYLSLDFNMVFTLPPLILACTFSLLIGLGFGFVPARNAALLNPVEALARE